ncbi:glycerate dehydrogenase, partial [Candidatus Dojkabacteria bacterium]|nr:glycerate dehydrogenase [Candidatus Dojkabacteria bacterium]
EECTKRGIKVSNVPDYCSATLSEFVFSMIINLTRDIFLADKHVEEGGWDFALFKGVELRGKKIGIIGAGSNGAAVIRIAQGYGMKALVYTHNPTNDKAKELGIPDFVSLEQLLKDSDFITVHVPLNKQTFHMLGENEFKQMKPGVYFINTARGAIVDSNALYSSLENERLAGVALDVLEESEPIEMSNVSDITRKIVQHPRSIVTPHIAFCSEESMQRLSEVSVGNIEAFLKGEPRNIVN